MFAFNFKLWQLYKCFPRILFHYLQGTTFTLMNTKGKSDKVNATKLLNNICYSRIIEYKKYKTNSEEQIKKYLTITHYYSLNERLFIAKESTTLLITKAIDYNYN